MIAVYVILLALIAVDIMKRVHTERSNSQSLKLEGALVHSVLTLSPPLIYEVSNMKYDKFRVQSKSWPQSPVTGCACQP
jgi:hypothetical protein